VASPSRVKSDRLWVVNVAGGTPENLLGNWKYEPGAVSWDTDGNITVLANTGGSTGLFRLDPNTKKLTQIVSGRRRINGASGDAKDTKIPFVATDMTHPTELYVANADGSGERRLTSFNDKLLIEVA